MNNTLHAALAAGLESVGDTDAIAILACDRQYSPAVVGEEVGEGRDLEAARHAETEVAHVPVGLGGGVGHVQREVFESHAGRGDRASVA